jgi:hypothetical protein
VKCPLGPCLWDLATWDKSFNAHDISYSSEAPTAKLNLPKGTTAGDGCSPQVLNGAFLARQRCSSTLVCQTNMVNDLIAQSTRVTCYCSAALLLTTMFALNTQVVAANACRTIKQ